MKRTATIFLTLTFVLVAAMAAFGQKRLLEDTYWKLVEANRTPVTNSMAAIEFDRTATQVSGNTGCNAMSGPVAIRGKNIDFGAMRTSKRACKLMEGNVDEGTFLRGIETARRFDVRRDELRLYDRRGRVTLRFVKASSEPENADEDARLDNRKWVLEQIKGRQTLVALPYAFVNFDSRKMSAGGNGSCNAFGGSYSVKGSTIKVKDVISTMMACSVERMSTEQDLFEGLRTADRYEIKDGRLMLFRGRQILLSFRGENKQ